MRAERLVRVAALAVATTVVASACGGESDSTGSRVLGERGAASVAADPDVKPLRDRDVPGFKTPECVVHDAVDDVYLVSNVHGDPFAADGNGFISQVTPDGARVTVKWIDGADADVTLNAPKGMVLVGDVLWVTDLDVVRRFDRATGAPRGAVTLPGATFLNDIAVDAEGVVWVTDTGWSPGFAASGSDAVWRIDGDEPSKVAASPDLGQPNGLAFGGSGDLFVVNWVGGEFSLLSTKSGERLTTTPLPGKQLDGIVRTRDGVWFVSSWAARCVYRVDVTGLATVRFGELDAPADIGYDAVRNRLLIPLFQDDKVLLRALDA